MSQRNETPAGSFALCAITAMWISGGAEIGLLVILIILLGGGLYLFISGLRDLLSAQSLDEVKTTKDRHAHA